MNLSQHNAPRRNVMYLSVAQARGYDGPVGDPFGGPAFGERNMPVVVIAAAVGSMAAGVAAFTAATTMVGMVAAGAMIAGGALTIIGTVTGNEKLTKIGGIVSLIGGVGTIGANMLSATSAEAANTAASSLGDVATDAGADAVGGAAADASLSTASDLSGGVTGASEAGGGLIDAAAPAANTATDAAGQAAGQVATETATSAPVASMEGFKTAAIDPFSAQTNVVQDAFKTAGDAALNPTTGMPGLTDVGANAAGGGTASQAGYMDNFGTFVKDNKDLTKIAVDGVTGLVPTNKTQAETDLAKAQAERIRLATAQEKQRQLWRQGLIG